jgi:hypothetical protein
MNKSILNKTADAFVKRSLLEIAILEMNRHLLTGNKKEWLYWFNLIAG